MVSKISSRVSVGKPITLFALTRRLDSARISKARTIFSLGMLRFMNWRRNSWLPLSTPTEIPSHPQLSSMRTRSGVIDSGRASTQNGRPTSAG